MNYPFAVYPRGVLSGYISYKHYVEEVIRLKNYIVTLKNNLSENNEVLKHLILINIGSAGEELIYYYHKYPEYNCEDNEYYQWRQIHPIYIEDFVNKYKKNLRVTVIIISPDEYQRDFDYDPAFTQNEIFLNKSAIASAYSFSMRFSMRFARTAWVSATLGWSAIRAIARCISSALDLSMSAISSKYGFGLTLRISISSTVDCA